VVTKHLALRALAGFVLLFSAILVVNLVLGVGPNLALRRLGATPDVRAFVGATLRRGRHHVGHESCPIFGLAWCR
jgi:hypothetical protein